MALTLTQSADYSTDVLKAGVIDELIKESPVLPWLPFIEIVGNSLLYNRLVTDAPIDFYDVGDVWTEGVAVTAQETAALKIMGGDADIDNFLRKTRSNVQDLEGVTIQMKAQALQRKFDDTFINGNAITDPKEFDGIDQLVCAGQTIYCDGAGSAAAELSWSSIDELIDLIRPGPPDLLIMNREARRKIRDMARSAGQNLEIGEGKLGQQVELYGTSEIAIADHLLASTCPGNGDTCFCIYAVKFGETGLCGLSAPGMIEVEMVGPLETKDASRTRIKWYPSLVLFSCLQLAKLCGCLTTEPV